MAENAESHFVLDHIAHHSALEALAILGAKFMAMMPAFEWSFLLRIGEITIPLEPADNSGPLAPPPDEAQRLKRRLDDRPFSGRASCSDGMVVWSWRRRHQPHPIHAGISGWR